MSDPLSLAVPTAGFVGSCLVSEKRGCAQWEGEFRISQRHCPSPLVLAPTILEPGPRLKKKEIKATQYQCGHPPGQRGPSWAVSRWGEPGSRRTCWPGLHLGPPTAASRYSQMLTPVATGASASLVEVKRRRWQGPNYYVLVGSLYLG